MALLCLCLVAGQASGQSVLFDFDGVPIHTPLPMTLTVGGITADFSATGQGYSVQSADVLGFTPAGFAGNCIYPDSVSAADLLVGFSQPLQDFSIMYAPEEYACDSSALMRVTGYLHGAFVATNTTTAPTPGTWPTGVLTLSAPQGFDSVVAHYDSPPPTGGDYGPIFMADNMTVTPAATNRYLIPGVAHNPGTAGTVWRTDVAAVDGETADATVTLTFRATGGTLTASAMVPAGGAVEWLNLVETLLGAAPDANLSGSLEVDSDQPLYVIARTYNDTPSGTYGQALPALTSSEALTPGVTGTLPMLRKSADFRTNVGAVNLGGSSATLLVRLFDGSGVQVGSDVTLSVPAGEWRQANDVFSSSGAGNQEVAFATVSLTAGDAAWVYASLVDARTGDPTTIPVHFAAAGATHRYLIPGVAHNPGAAGTIWRTDVAAVDADTAEAAVTLTFRSTGGTLTASATVPAGGAVEWLNVVETILGAAPDANLSGALEVVSDRPLVVTARTYNDTPAGTYGQGLPGLITARGLVPGVTGILPMLRRSADFRTNVGAVNLGGSSATLLVRLFDGSGLQVGNDVTLSVPAGEWRQANDVFESSGAGTQEVAFATVSLTAGEAAWVYASLVDNHTGDPTTVDVIKL